MDMSNYRGRIRIWSFGNRTIVNNNLLQFLYKSRRCAKSDKGLFLRERLTDKNEDVSSAEKIVKMVIMIMAREKKASRRVMAARLKP